MQLSTNQYICANKKYEEADIVIFGAPFDGTSSYRSGSRFAPDAIREASRSIETYSPLQLKDTEDLKIADIGDLELPFGEKIRALNQVKKLVKDILRDGKVPVAIGGEHLISVATIEECYKKYKNLNVVQLDAHADLRDQYMGERLSHATVMRRISELIGFQNIYQFGIRSGLKEELSLCKKNNIIYQFSKKDFERLIKAVAKKPTYITLDIDVFDPSFVPGVGNPEAGGICFNTVMTFLEYAKKLHIVGLDLVELSPHCDPSNISSFLAAKLLREMLLVI
ncbi:MAG: agmatinase [bacterium]|nr:agmatinase [bacterium]